MSIETEYQKLLNAENLLAGKRIKKIIEQATREISVKIYGRNVRLPKTGAGGAFLYNKRLKLTIEDIFAKMNLEIQAVIESEIKSSWKLSNNLNDEILKKYMAGIVVPGDLLKKITNRNMKAMNAFIKRSQGGLNLSKRIWRHTKVAKSQIELYLGTGILEGKSAASLSRDVRELLMEPKRLFRRVRDKNGNLVLSKAARKYHPGQGVYRSSYKNALRLTATENNMAYRMADHLRHVQTPFILGIQIVLSAQHPRPDICDELQGRYPKGFFFMGWHSWCICHSRTILPKKDDFVKYLKTGKLNNRRFVSSIPRRANRFLKRNRKNILGMKTQPFWMENFTQDMKLRSEVLKYK